MPEEVTEKPTTAPKSASTGRPKFVGEHAIEMNVPVTGRVLVEPGDALPDGLEAWQVNSEDWK